MMHYQYENWAFYVTKLVHRYKFFHRNKFYQSLNHTSWDRMYDSGVHFYHIVTSYVKDSSVSDWIIHSSLVLLSEIRSWIRTLKFYYAAPLDPFHWSSSLFQSSGAARNSFLLPPHHQGSCFNFLCYLCSIWWQSGLWLKLHSSETV